MRTAYVLVLGCAVMSAGCEWYLGVGEGILWECPQVVGACVCGDNRVSPDVGEECDDGNTDDADGCSADCKLERIVSVVAGAYHTCALTNHGAVKCWGDNRYGQLGLGHRENRGDEPKELTAPGSAVALGKHRVVSALGAGAFHTCALFQDGRVKCWGLNGIGQLGLSDSQNRGDDSDEMGDDLPEVTFADGQKAIQLAVGAYYTCVVLENRRARCWGANGNGQLGLGDTAPRRSALGPANAPLSDIDLGPEEVSNLAAGGYFTCALMQSGTVKCWGQNQFGQLGLGDSASRGDGTDEMGEHLPSVQLGSDSGMTSIALGYAHVCVRLMEGNVKCWGANDHGQLGLEDDRPRGLSIDDMNYALPTVNFGNDTPQEISAGGTHTCALMSNGNIRCWGGNSFGQLGLGDTLNRGDEAGEMGMSLPDVSLDMKKATMVTSGETHSCALMEDGSVHCWGGNAHGELGAGDTETRGDGPGEMVSAVKLFR